MPRFLVVLPPPMLTWLREESIRSGRTMSELIREFVSAGINTRRHVSIASAAAASIASATAKRGK